MEQSTKLIVIFGGLFSIFLAAIVRWVIIRAKDYVPKREARDE